MEKQIINSKAISSNGHNILWWITKYLLMLKNVVRGKCRKKITETDQNGTIIFLTTQIP